MAAFSDNNFADKLVDQRYDEAELAMALASLPSVPARVPNGALTGSSGPRPSQGA